MDIGVEPEDAPDEYILNQHRTATQAASTQADKAECARALTLIGRARGSETMIRLGESGQTVMSVSEAYAALSCPQDAVDDGIVM